MSVWARNDMIIVLRRTDNGKYDTATHTVLFRPVSVGTSGDIAATQLDSLYAYKPNAVGDTEEAYDIYVDGAKKKRIFGPNLLPPIET
jgi:hypothetical protein